MEKQLIDTYDLDNGLKLELYDACRKLIGDRWLVKLVARMDVPVEQVLASSRIDLPADAEAIRKAVGDNLEFEQVRERNFISKEEKEELFRKVCEDYLASSRQYLGHPDFGPRLVLKTFHEAEKKRQLTDAMGNG